MQLWFAQMLFNFLWSPTVFRFHNLGAGLAVILTMLVLIVAFIVPQWRRDRTAAVLFIPYACWVTFAASLNATLFSLT